MRKTIIGFIFGFVLALSVSAYAGTVIKSAVYNDTKVKLDGTPLTLSAQFATIVNDGQSNGSNFAPIRALCEAMGYSVDWDRQTNTILLESPLTDLETVVKSCKDSCVMVYAYGNNILSQGSGWVYNGYVVTAKHVVDGYESVFVEKDNATYTIKCDVLYMDNDIDLAILSPMDNLYLPSVKLGETAKEGEKLVSITSPSGSKNSIDECIYVGLGQNVLYKDLFNVSESEMSNGSSGGAIFNYNSELIGMVVKGREKNNFAAVPVRKIKPILEQQIK